VKIASHKQNRSRPNLRELKITYLTAALGLDMVRDGPLIRVRIESVYVLFVLVSSLSLFVRVDVETYAYPRETTLRTVFVPTYNKETAILPSERIDEDSIVGGIEPPRRNQN
jgi:hypothetical protein